MKPIAKSVRNTVESLSPGALIRQGDLSIPAGKEMAAAQALSRLVKQGALERIEKGLYYKPKQSKYGTLRPDANQLLKEILTQKQGYLTDTAAYNSFGITTQLPSTIVIAGSRYSSPRTIAGLTIRYRRSKVKSNTASSEVLQVLDALRSIKRIPDATPDQVLSRIIEIITSFTFAQKKELLSCALEYNPSVRALVSAIFDEHFNSFDTSFLAESLNPLSSYKIDISFDILPNKTKWNIK
jgi:hypothetical protein